MATKDPGGGNSDSGDPPGAGKAKDTPGESQSASKAKTKAVRVEIDGRQDINRAVHGDVVAIELMEGGEGEGEGVSPQKGRPRGIVGAWWG